MVRSSEIDPVRKRETEHATDILPFLTQMGGSPQGARPKVLVWYNQKTEKINNSVLLIDGVLNGFESWLVKFPAQNDHIEVCAIEALYMQLAMKSGLNVNECKHFELGSKLSAFGIRRFDRNGNNRILAHTLAGLLHADFRTASAVDYATFLKTVRLLTSSEQQVLQAFRQCVFNIIFNNRDDHPKNFTFLLNQKNLWELSPVYDLTFSYGPGGEHHMDICGEGLAPGLNDLVQLSEQLSLNKNKVRKIIDEVAEVATTFKKQTQKWPIRKKTVDLISSKIQKNLKNIL